MCRCRYCRNLMNFAPYWCRPGTKDSQSQSEQRVVRDIAAESDVGTFRDPHFWRQTLGKQGNVSYHGRGLKDADIAALTRALEGNTSLGKINLSANKFGDEGVLALASLLRRNATLEDVRLASNTFSEGAAEELAKALLENSSITELEVPRDHRRLIRSALHDKRRIRRETSSTTSGSDSSSTESDHGQQNDTKVPRTAKQNSARPRAGNKQGSASKNLSATSEQYWRGILGTQSDLSLRDRRLQDDEVTALAKALETNSRLQSLNLCGNLIGDDGARALAKALRSNSTLRSLHLKDNPFGIDGARALADALKDNGALSVLNGPKAHRQIFLDAIGGPRGIDRGAAAATESEDSELAFDDPDKDAPESEDSDIAMDEPDELEQGHGGSQSQHSSSSWSSGAQQVPLAVVPFREHLEVTVKEIHEEYKTYKRRERRYQLAYRSKTKSTWNGTIIREIGVLTFPKPEYGTVPFDRADFLVDLGASDALLVEFKVGKGKLKPKDKDDFIGQLRGYLDDATNFGCLEAGFSGNKWHGFGPVFRPRFIGGFMVRFDNSQSAHEPDVYWVPWPEK
ncbi:hypothetical protein DFJ74DRAFT_321226 [Hyaloraphidium curvatum]|nr:hypothetical protein DFJ74DRAFT_321226 [Hyaloraphidium curvatum]